jgi:hypothetical protein
MRPTPSWQTPYAASLRRTLRPRAVSCRRRRKPRGSIRSGAWTLAVTATIARLSRRRENSIPDAGRYEEANAMTGARVMLQPDRGADRSHDQGARTAARRWRSRRARAATASGQGLAEVRSRHETAAQRRLVTCGHYQELLTVRSDVMAVRGGSGLAFRHSENRVGFVLSVRVRGAKSYGRACA